VSYGRGKTNFRRRHPGRFAINARIEDRTPQGLEASRAYPRTGKAYVIGVTGVRVPASHADRQDV